MTTRLLPFKKKKASFTGNQASLLRHLNTLKVLEALQKYGAISRADLARITGISGPTITRTVIDLLRDKLVEEGEPIRIQLGRPGRVIRLASTKALVVGVVLDREQCHVLSSGLNGETTTDTESFPIPATYEALIENLAQAIKARKSKQGVRIMGTGLVVRALINKHDQKVSSCPDLPLLEGHKFSNDLCQATGFETVVVQPALGMCFAERLYGKNPDMTDFAVIDIRNGFDVSVVLNGKVLSGHSGFALNFQSDEFKGEAGLLKVERIDNTPPFLDALAEKIISLIRVLNPEKIFIASTLLENQPTTLEALVNKVHSSLPQPMYSSLTIGLSSSNRSEASIAAIITSLTTERKHTSR